MTHPVLIIHGALGAASQLEPVKLAFQNLGLTAYTLDLSGHGGSAFQTKFGIEQFAADVLQWLDEHGIQKVNIFGYSMGGYVALRLANDHPDRVGAIVTLGTKFDWSIESAVREVAKLNPDKIIEKIPAFARILEKRHAPNDWKELLHKTSGMMRALGEQPLLTPEILQSITTPVRVYLGDQDDMADRAYSMQVAHWLPNGKFFLVANTPHPIEKVSVENLTTLVNESFR